MPQAPQVTNYSFEKVSVIVKGQFLTAFMDGSVIKCSKNEDNKVPHVGADGGVTFATNTDNTGTITITLKQTSPSLTLIASLQDSATPFPIQVIDANKDGKFRAGGTQAVILKTPDRERGKEVTGVEVSFYVADYSSK